MVILKQVESSKIVLYSFETERETNDILSRTDNKILFIGTRIELLGEDDEFWKPLVKDLPISEHFWNYRIRLDCTPCKTPSESGRSAIHDAKEFILITQEKI